MLDWKNRFARLGRSKGSAGTTGHRSGSPLLLILAGLLGVYLSITAAMLMARGGLPVDEWDMRIRHPT